MAIVHKSLKEHVYEYLYEKINNGSLKPRERIRENQICKDLEVSRTPIREALLQLEDEGYIERQARRGFRVKEISSAKIKEIFEIIGCLEGFAASAAMDKMVGGDFLSLKTLIRKMDRAIQSKRLHNYFRLQRNFHNVYVLASGNKELCDLIASLKKRFVKKAYFIHDDEDLVYEILERNNTEHKTIIKLFEQGDRPGIEAYLRNVHWNFEHANLIVSPFESSNVEAK